MPKELKDLPHKPFRDILLTIYRNSENTADLILEGAGPIVYARQVYVSSFDSDLTGYYAIDENGSFYRVCNYTGKADPIEIQIGWRSEPLLMGINFCTDEGFVYTGELSATFRHDRNTFDLHAFSFAWKKNAKLYADSFHMNPIKARTFLTDYQVEFAKAEEISPMDMLISPQLEQLKKAGFTFADEIVYSISSYQVYETNSFKNRRKSRGYTNKAEQFEQYNRLTQPGSKIKTIFKTSKIIYEVLKEEKSLEIWDLYRKLDKQGKISKDIVQQVYDARYSKEDLDKISTILNAKYEDKPVFTWTSLQAYLGRLDMYEAIELKEAYQILTDYLHMCSMLEMRPRIDGDSLKREHDIAARLCRERRNEIMEKRMKESCEYLSEFDYEESVFFARGIRSQEDLIDEAKQQHNCVAVYADRIAKKTSLIFVMREKCNPDKSLVTIELSPDCSTVRQKFLAYNQPIRNKAMTEFIERFQKHAKAVYQKMNKPAIVAA